MWPGWQSSGQKEMAAALLPASGSLFRFPSPVPFRLPFAAPGWPRNLPGKHSAGHTFYNGLRRAWRLPGFCLSIPAPGAFFHARYIPFPDEQDGQTYSLAKWQKINDNFIEKIQHLKQGRRGMKKLFLSFWPQPFCFAPPVSSMAAWAPSGDVNVIVAYKAGSGTDTGARIRF